jgi:hypothetical protein
VVRILSLRGPRIVVLVSPPRTDGAGGRFRVDAGTPGVAATSTSGDGTRTSGIPSVGAGGVHGRELRRGHLRHGVVDEQPGRRLDARAHLQRCGARLGGRNSKLRCQSSTGPPSSVASVPPGDHQVRQRVVVEPVVAVDDVAQRRRTGPAAPGVRSVRRRTPCRLARTCTSKGQSGAKGTATVKLSLSTTVRRSPPRSRHHLAVEAPCRGVRGAGDGVDPGLPPDGEVVERVDLPVRVRQGGADVLTAVLERQHVPDAPGPATARACGRSRWRRRGRARGW